MLYGIGLSNIFLDLFPQIRGTKAKISKGDYIKLKGFCIAKKTINKTERQPTEWKKIITNDILNKGPISKIYKELIQLNNNNKKKA